MAEFKLTMSHPDYPKGTEIELDGIGVIPNGDSVTVTKEMQDAWQAINPGVDFKKSLANNGALEFSGKEKLMDSTPTTDEIDPEVQAARDPRNVDSGGDK